MPNSTLVNILPDPTLDFTQVIIVETAGIPIQGPNVKNVSGWYLKSSPNNSGIIHFMFHGQTLANKGFPLSSGDIIYVPIDNLNSLDFDSTVNGDKIHASKA